jgi:hypothetical protein
VIRRDNTSPSFALRSGERITTILATCLMLAGMTVALLPSLAQADLELKPGSFEVTSSTDQAGAYPDMTTSFRFLTHNNSTEGNVKDVTVDLPPGFAGAPGATPTCTAQQLQESGSHTACPIGSQVGTIELSIRDEEQPVEVVEPLFNMTAAPGTAATLGFNFSSILVQELFVTVRPGDAGLQVTVPNINGSLQVSRSSVTVWGVPSDPSHDTMRGARCFFGVCNGGGVVSTEEQLPFLSNPTRCTNEPLTATITADSWQQRKPIEASTPVGPMTGCEKLGFSPSISLQPTTLSAYSPMGLNVGVSVPQSWNTPVGLETSNLDDAVVTLPEGVTVNPSAGAGLGACTPEEYAAETAEVSMPGGAGCPEDSKLGTVRIETPVLKEDATGAVYLAKPSDNPFDSLLALYIVAKIPDRGVIVKTAGKIELNPVTGQLTTTFAENPQLPFSHFTLSFYQGTTSPLVSPPDCGVFTGQASLSGWSEPSFFDTVGNSFEIPDGIGDGPCPADGVPPFHPGLVAGTVSNNAGAYSPMGIDITRKDGEQEITGFSSRLPPGITANLSGVPFCSEADIALSRTKTGAGEEASPSCPTASEIGHTLVGAGVGSVLAYAPGKVYLAGPFEGAPFSIAAITSAKVGPFDLGTVVVHLPLDINPETAAVTIPAGAADQIPHIIKGIVVHVRDIRVYIDRQDFMLNPTNCDPQTLSATVIGGGANPTNSADSDPVTITDPFQVADCASLAFKPKFSASTLSKDHFNGNGASLTVHLAADQGPSSNPATATEANISKVKVELPKALPSRLTTLQKACTAAQFNANPAGCPAASMIGYATVHTPILPVPLTGPAIFVSHGGEAFPSLILVLQGYGIKIDLVGTTFISHTGITSSTFKTVPDQPFNTFELTLPTGKYSALAAITDVCKPTKKEDVKKRVAERVHGKLKEVTKKVAETVAAPLEMPTEIVAQNGATLEQSTKIAVTGCAKAKKSVKKKGKKGKAKKHPKGKGKQ